MITREQALKWYKNLCLYDQCKIASKHGYGNKMYEDITEKEIEEIWRKENMNTINIEGREFTIDELKSLIKNQGNPMSKVYAFHNTTKEEFDKLYEKLPLRSKYLEIEAMIVAYKNNGWAYKDGDRMYYPYFKLNPFSFGHSNWNYTNSNVPLALCFKNEKLANEAVKEFEAEYKLSRLTQ